MRRAVVDALLLDGERPPECLLDAAITAGARRHHTPCAHSRREIPAHLEGFLGGQHCGRAARLAPVLEPLFVHVVEGSSDIRQPPLHCIEFSQGCSGNPRVPSAAEQSIVLNARWAAYLSRRGALSERRKGSAIALGVVAPAGVMKTLGSSCGVENSWLTFHRNEAKVLEPPPVRSPEFLDFLGDGAVGPIRHHRKRLKFWPSVEEGAGVPIRHPR